MTDLSLASAIEFRSGLIGNDGPTDWASRAELRASSLIDLAKGAIGSRDAVLLEAVFVGFAGVPIDFTSQHYVIRDKALRRDLDRVRADVIDAFVEVDPRRAAECFTRYAGHRSEVFFHNDCFASSVAIRALCRLGDSTDDLAFIRTVFPRALKDAASVLMDGDAEVLDLAQDAAALLKKLRAVPAYAADVDAATRAIITGLRESNGSAEHIALYERILPANVSDALERPASRRSRGKPASHER